MKQTNAISLVKARRLNSRQIKFLDREVAVKSGFEFLGGNGNFKISWLAIIKTVSDFGTTKKASMEKHAITQMFLSGEIPVLLPNGRNGVISNSVQR